MILIDTALQRRAEADDPIRVGLVGAGFMGRPITLRLLNEVPGIELVCVVNRHPEKALHVLTFAGADPVRVQTVEALEAAIAEGRPAYTDDPTVLCAADGVDLILDATGAVDYGCALALDAIAHGKHLLLMNTEIDGTVGPLLKAKADEAGVMYGQADGDQPGVIMNLYRFVKGLGCTPKLLGNIKGLQDPYRTPTTQKAFAERWGQKPHMVTSYADGTKVNFEMAIVANNTGFKAAKRGLYQPVVPPDFPIEEIAAAFPLEEVLASDGLVDYCVGGSPNPGVFCLATQDDPTHRHYLELYKAGPGPLYCFYNPYHLVHFELPNSIVRMVDFADAPVVPIGGPVVEVVTIAKTDIAAGETLDGIGWFHTFGECENHDIARREGLLPMAMAEGARAKRNIPKDASITLDDVELAPRLVSELFDEQARHFAGQPMPTPR